MKGHSLTHRSGYNDRVKMKVLYRRIMAGDHKSKTMVNDTEDATSLFKIGLGVVIWGSGSIE